MTRINEVLYFVLYDLCKKKRRRTSLHLSFPLVRPSGIEPPHTAPEADALSTELRAHSVWCTMHHSEL